MWEHAGVCRCVWMRVGVHLFVGLSSDLVLDHMTMCCATIGGDYRVDSSR